jgi:NhaP-type Na+/H+ or K+/H+ antiporter
MTEAQFLATLALVGAVIVVSALLSGFIDRSRLPHVAVFLVLGAMIGPAGLNLLDATSDSQVLRTVSTLSLVLVLFTDALSINFSEIRRNALLSFLMVGPGTLFSAVLMAIAAWGLLGLSPTLAAMLGAALASTDPVLLRAIVRGPDIDPAVKQALRIEGGMNDAVLLPILLIAVSLSQSFTGSHTTAGHVAINVLLLGPAAGVVVGLVSVAALDLIRKRVGVRSD